MGNVSSTPNSDTIYLKDQSRFSLAALTISNVRKRVVLDVTPNAYPASRIVARRDTSDDTPIQYIQDPENSSPSFLIKIDLEEELDFRFRFITRQTSLIAASQSPSTATDTTINGLTFAFAPNARELDTLVTREFHADPNLHKNANVHLIGDYTTSGSPAIEYEWQWRWKPPKPQEDRGGGWRNNCSFLEYDSRAHRLNTLGTFKFWVNNRTSQSNMALMSPSLELTVPTNRSRIASSHSYYSAISDSEGAFDAVHPPSPRSFGHDFVTVATVPVPSAPVVDVSCQRPGEDMSAVDDGPLFRATMKSLEQKTGNMRVQMKKVLKKAEAAHQAQLESNQAVRAFLGALQEASASNANAIKPALDHYFKKIAQRILQYEGENVTLLQRQIIEPLSKLYQLDIKQAEFKKKDFEDESRDYYAYVSRYLGQRQDSMKDKKRAESDSKYQFKKRNFELKRFDYSSFMQDLHGGRKEQELLSQLTKYADGQARSFLATAKEIEGLQPQLEALVREVADADKEYNIQRTEREEKRRNLEKGEPVVSEADIVNQNALHSAPDSNQNGVAGYNSESELSRADSTSSQFAHSIAKKTLSPSNSLSHSATNGALATSPGSAMTPQSKFKGIRDLEERDLGIAMEKSSSNIQRKEGLIWAMRTHGSHIDPVGIKGQGWHKFWLVLDRGKLSEYSNWKDKLDLHREPIDLRMASVRMARDADRRFCFEVITPQYKRVYQATSEEDMNSWIMTINNALQSAVEGRNLPSTPVPAQSEGYSREYKAMLVGKSASQSGHHSQGSSNDAAGVNRRITVGARPTYTRTSSNSFEENPSKLLEQIRNNDRGNAYCADCGSSSKVEWVSLNLGIILCIECGGIHRSLGTHVSKIRSLTLDTHSFTTDIVELMLLIGNRVSNMVWEAKLDPSSKPTPSGSRDQRLRFITQKYVDRAFVDHLSAPASHFATADENLLTSIKRNDPQGVLLAIAQRANVNVHDRSRNTHAVFLALAAADPAYPASMNTPAGSPNNNSRASNKAFPMAELLVQNGAEIPVELPAIPLSAAAQLYIEQRTTRSTDILGPLPSRGPLAPDQTAKLQKRGSAGARFAGRVSGLER